MASQALLDDNEIVRLLMLLNRKNKNGSDLLVYLQKDAYTGLGRFNQTKFPKIRCQKKSK